MSRRALRLCLASLWLIDGVLQVQAFMFGRGLGRMVAETAQGNPAVVAATAGWSARFIGAHGALATTVIAVTEIVIGLGIAWRPAVRVALAASVAWSLGVWAIGEAFGGLLTPLANPAAGAPGAVLLYAVLAVVLWPGRGAGPTAGPALAWPARFRPAREQPARFRPALWAGLWLGLAVLWARLGIWSPGALRASAAAAAAGQPAWLEAADRGLAGALAGSGQVAEFALAGVFALIASAPAWPARPRRAVLGLAIAAATALWLAQGLGGVLTGMATDPNSGPLLALLALAYWPVTAGGPGTAAAAAPGSATSASSARTASYAPAAGQDLAPARAHPLAIRFRQAASGRDIDAMNVLMAVAMAAMLAGRFSPVPDGFWRITFAVAAAWFGGHAVRNWRLRASAGQHVTHLLSCGGMLVMLAAPGAGRGLAGPMSTMSGPAAAMLPVLAAGFAVAMAVSAVLVTDKLAATAAVPGAAVPGPASAGPARAGPARPGLAAFSGHRAAGCPRLRSSCQIAMGLVMSCMLIQML